jgi:hypothetical protein
VRQPRDARRQVRHLAEIIRAPCAKVRRHVWPSWSHTLAMQVISAQRVACSA